VSKDTAALIEQSRGIAAAAEQHKRRNDWRRGQLAKEHMRELRREVAEALSMTVEGAQS